MRSFVLLMLLTAGLEPAPFHILVGGRPGRIVLDALKGAQRRREWPQCRQLLTELRDGDGHPLSALLEKTGRTAADYLAELYFVDADREVQCQRDETVAAFTEPRSHVVHVCSQRFSESFARNTTGGEMLLIHELLHTLGLGENPPGSSQITAMVFARCGR